ncbi:hypothetical protein ASPZODRAFT_133705 [Penicilliopsis zonata CBS 506.65]|uniref:Long-chain-alcohol oxidase n=1 Tax=Penicilliopsis zonata CBS 506.65 TaxID=1073090 RepID=A0A1L9SF89_9EURO|nr:hypothetical protein ASPZODRAFT_133705 [Penicilliopsis zonata CBS 506.65]OJJ45839.1 hypothetical protein ASPZODRAFT_133705 [Penicilliopsis zonata CBS 506.65]
MESYTPLEPVLPPTPQTEIFSEIQWKTILSLADTVIPAIRPAEAASTASSDLAQKSLLLPSEQYVSAQAALRARIPATEAASLAEQYLSENPSSIPGFRDAIQCLFANNVHPEGRKGITFILTALNTRAGSLLLTGSTTMIYDQPLDVREQILSGWRSSRIPALRAVYRALTIMFKKTWISLSPTLFPVIGCPRVPVHGKPALGFEYEFLQFPPGDEPETIQADVVIIGSGCGGGVAAKNLAEAGLRVVVVEKSYHYPSKYFPMAPSTGSTHLFENGGAVMSDDGVTAVVAGSTWGGGGTINWSAALQTQGYVRQEWADEGLPFFTSLDFQNSLDRVCERMGVQSEHTVHNYGNELILDSSRKLGYAAYPVPQNTGNGEHYCGYCTLGCAAAAKKGPTESFLTDAAKAGAVFIEGFRADKVLLSPQKVATGVSGTWTSRDLHLGISGQNAVERQVIIQAKKVIVSCGSLSSPLLLLRSGIRNSLIGRNLHLHPVALGCAIWDQEVRPWEGSALTTVVTEFENQDGHGHGVKIQACTMMPSIFLPLLSWRDGQHYKRFCSDFAHATSFLTLTRDHNSGRVYPDPVDGRCRIDYTPSALDRRHIVEGLIACAKIAYIGGAKEFHTTYEDMPPFIRPDSSPSPAEGSDGEGANNAALQAWIATLRSKSPLNPEFGSFASAHQMGTCRMGSSARNSVVGPDSQVWGTEGVYVMDASVFPSASGVNPMLTNMAITDWASRNLAKAMTSAVSSRL